MFKGLELIKKSFKRERVYVLNHIVNNIGSIIFGYINVCIWLSVLGKTPEGMKTVTYLMVNQASLWLVMFLPHGCYIPEKVRDGTIAFEMLRPYSLLYGSFFRVIGHLLYNLFFRSLPIFAFGVLFMEVALPQMDQLLPYAVILVNGIIIAFFINYFVGLWSIKFLSINGIQMIYYFTTTLFSGAFIHFKFYPPTIKNIILNLPFAYTTYVPTAVYQGEFSFSKAFFSQWLWIILLCTVAYVLTQRISKNLVIQGG